MPRFGAHLSIAGGLEQAYARAAELPCETMQIFTKNASQWQAPPLPPAAVRAFAAATADHPGIAPVFAHDSYLINLASPDPAKFAASVKAFVIELQRAAQLGIPYLVTHPGSHLGSGEEAGLRKMAAGLDEVFRATGPLPVTVLLETTAGQGTNLGWRFEHLRTILDGVKHPDRFGICYDTCHTFAAGYDLRTPEAFAATFEHFDRIIGLERLTMIHLNDALKGLGSRVDRHTHIGEGFLGTEAFRLLVNAPGLRDLPMILETPKGDDPVAADRKNLKTLRGLVRTKRTRPPSR